MNDCRDLQYAFFFDPLRSPRLADRLEEDLIHHATVLSECNARNVTLKADAHPALSQPTSKFTIIGQHILSAFLSLLGFYYRAMHYSAKRGLAITCRLSVRLSVCL